MVVVGLQTFRSLKREVERLETSGGGVVLGQKTVCEGGNNPSLPRSEIGMLVDKERIKIDERTLYARPPSLVLMDAMGVVSGKHVARNERWMVRRRGEPLLVVF